MPRFDLGGCELYYEDQGQGQPLLFVHGVWMSSRFFKHQLSDLSSRYRVLALDLRGHGRSTKVPLGHTVATYARDLHAFIEGLGLEQVVLVGWSMGSFVTWDYVKQFGTQHLKAAVLVDQSASDFRWPDWEIGVFDFPGLCHAMQLVQTDRDGFIHEFIGLMTKEPPSAEDRAWMFDEITRLPESVASAILFDQSVQDYRPVLPQVTIPALVCVGRDEKLTPVAAGEHLVTHLPQARLVIFEQSSHMPFLEEPQRFNTVLDEFVSGLGYHTTAGEGR